MQFAGQVYMGLRMSSKCYSLILRLAQPNQTRQFGTIMQLAWPVKTVIQTLSLADPRVAAVDLRPP